MFRRLLPFRNQVFERKQPSADFAAQAMAPVAQARRCLDIWLAEEGRSLAPAQRHRAAALIARYFSNEDGLSDGLILSFLRHYSGRGVVDLDDPQAVRMELKAVLDRAQSAPPGLPGVSRMRLAAVWGVTVVAVVVVAVTLTISHQPLTPAQQQSLRHAVTSSAAATGQPPARVWASLKRELGVARYEDIRRHDYRRALRLAAER